MKEIQAKAKPFIDPKELFAELNQYSDDYYKKLRTPKFQQGKPFTAPSETAQNFIHLGLMLEALQLGAPFKILDFGASTCWVSKILWQMGCSVVSTDVSKEALKLGKELFEQYPVPKVNESTWEHKPFDGHRIDAGDEIFDRIICYDVFHHVPNQEVVIKEFHRTLKEGGIIDFSEPVREFSTSEKSQQEMREYTVLENDLDIHQLKALFNSVGFKGPFFKVAATDSFSLTTKERDALMRGDPQPNIIKSIQDFAGCKGVFWFTKGNHTPGSRKPEGLAHTMRSEKNEFTVQQGHPLEIELQATNTGSSKWLHTNESSYGVVSIGTHLIDPDSLEIVAEHARASFPQDIEPG